MLFHPASSRLPPTGSPAPGDRRRSSPNDDSAAAALRELWVAALDDYCRTVEIDLRGHILLGELETCESSDQIFGVLCAASTYLKSGHGTNQTSSQFAKVMKHVVVGLSEFARALNGIARSTDFPGVKEIFAALALLLNAAHRVHTEYKDAEKLIDRFRAYIDRLTVRMRAPMGDEARTIALNALVKLLNAFALATKLLKQNRGVLFLKSLFVKGGALQSAMHDLETTVSDEEMMGITDIIVGMHQFSAEIFYVKKTTQTILDELQESKARDQTQHDAVMERLKAIEANDRANNEVVMKKLQDIQDQLERRASLPDPDLTTARDLGWVQALTDSPSLHPSRDLPEADDGEQVEGEEEEGWYTTGHGSSTSTWSSPPRHLDVSEPTYMGAPSLDPAPDSVYMQMPRAMPQPYPQTVLPRGLGMSVQTYPGYYSLENPAPMPSRELGWDAHTHRDHQVLVPNPRVAGAYIQPFRPSSPSYGRTPMGPSFPSPPHRRSTIQEPPRSCCTPPLAPREPIVLVCGRPLRTKGHTVDTTLHRGMYGP